MAETDFITLGTPMYFADLRFTRSRGEFKDVRSAGQVAFSTHCAQRTLSS
jgi:hypothetical protein